MKKLYRSLCLSTLVLIAPLSADEVDDAISRFTNSYHAGSNALMIFTSQDLISGGSYTFEDENDLKLYSIPYKYHFKNSSWYNYFAKFSLGYSSYTEKVNLVESLPSSRLLIETYAARIGLGVRFKTAYDIDFSLSTSLIYSYTNGDFNYGSHELKDALARLDDVLNSSSSNYTSEVTAGVAYHKVIAEYKPYAELESSLFYTSSSFELTDYTAQSLYTKLTAGVLSPPLFTLYDVPVKLEGYFNQVFISGEMVDTFNIKNYSTLGTTFHLDATKYNEYISEVYINFNVLRGHNIEGYNYGFGASF